MIGERRTLVLWHGTPFAPGGDAAVMLSDERATT